MHNIPTETGGNEDDVDAMNFESLSHAIESIPNGHTDRHVSDVPPTSAHSNISHFEELNEGIGPLDRLRYELVVPLYEEGDPEWADAFPRSPNKVLPAPPVVRILVSLPPTYPDSASPQLQLLGRYLGQYSIDSEIFGEVTRAYISKDGVPFTPGDVCVFEGIQYTLSVTRRWYIERLREGKSGEQARNVDRKRGTSGRAMGDLPSRGGLFAEHGKYAESFEDSSSDSSTSRPALCRQGYSDMDDPLSVGNPRRTSNPRNPLDMLPDNLQIFSSAPITVSKSVFVGHACRVTDPLEVPLVIHQLLGDKKIAKATHPVIHAYRISRSATAAVSTSVILADNDDDGETAAGGRLAHLLQILELEDILVVVTRWYGGTLLGPERFKLINQAARDALELGGFLGEEGGLAASSQGGSKSGKKIRR